MKTTAQNIRNFLRAGISVCILLIFISASGDAQDARVEHFDEAVAQKLLSTLRDGFVGQNATEALSVFDAERMPNYSSFAAQVRALFGLHTNFRIYYKVLDVNAAECKDTECGDATVQFSMEADDVTGQPPGLARETQLQVRFMRTSSGWKIVDLTPREFFR